MLKGHLLGQFAIFLDGKLVEIPSRPAQSLIAFLLLHAGVQHRRDKLVGLFWPDASEENARRSLRQALWHVRRSLEPVDHLYLQTDDICINFHLSETDWVDALVFGKRIPATSNSEDIIKIVSTYQGELLPGFYEDWAILERERLQAVFEQNIGLLLDRLVQEQRWEEVLVWGEHWIAMGLTPEQAFRSLMLAYHGLGNQSAVVATYRRCVDALDRELGISPSEQTRLVYQSLRNGAAVSIPDQKRLVLPQVPIEKSVAKLTESIQGPPPFKGLHSFEEEDADLFFGREQLTTRLVDRINARQEEPGLISIVGSSGSGKSSLVRAGLIPALRRSASPVNGYPSFPNARAWEVFLIVPTQRPLEALATSLTKESESVSAAATLVDDLAQDPRSLGLFLTRRRVTSKKGIYPPDTLLVIDQFEELFTQCRDDAERQAFIDNLLYAASDEHTQVVITLRADFYAHCASYGNLRLALASSQEYIGSMNASELRRAIEEPARKFGLEFEPGLVDLILHDVGITPGGVSKTIHQVEPGALPLLSHALLETWTRRHDRMLTLVGYTESGGVRGAIARTAENTYTRLPENEQHLARSVFLRLTELVEVGEAEFTPPDTRRRVTLEELIPSGVNRADVLKVLNILAEARLVTLGQGVVEVAHEALIREWPTLRHWLADDREGLRLHRRLTDAALEWQAMDREPGELFRGVRLVQVLEWVTHHPDEVNDLEHEFLEASRAWALREAAEQETARARTLEAAQRLAEVESRRVDEQKLSNRKLRWLASGLGVLLVAAVILALFVIQQRDLANMQSKLATSRELASSAVASLAVDPELSVLLALRAVATQDTFEAEDALHQAVQNLRLLRTFPLQRMWGLGGVFSPDGKKVAVSSLSPDPQDRHLMTEVWDTDTGKLLLTLPGGLIASTWPDSSRLATISPGEGVTTLLRFWDPDTGNLISSNTLAHSYNLVNGDFDPRWTHIAEKLGDGTLIVSDIATGRLLYRIGIPGSIFSSNGVAFSPDGLRIAASVGNLNKMYEAASGNVLFSLPSVDNGSWAIAFSPDGKSVAVALNGLVKIADAADGKVLLTLTGNSGLVVTLNFSPDGKRIAAGTSDSKAVIWDTTTGENMMTLAGPSKSIDTVRFSPDGSKLLTSSYDQAARLWDVTPAGSREELAWYDVQGQAFSGVAFSPDGMTLAASGGGIQGYVWEVVGGKSLLQLPGQGSLIGTVAYSPDGNEIAITAGSELVKILDAKSGKVKHILYGHADWVGGLAYSPDGLYLVTISYDKTAAMWDVASGKLMYSLSIDSMKQDFNQLIGVAFSPDGSMFATSNGNSAIIWDSASGQKRLTITPQDELVYKVAFSPDNKRLATGLSLGQGILIWDVATGEKLLTLLGHRGSVQGLVFTKDGKQIISGSVDGMVKIWDAVTGTEQLTLVRQTSQIMDISLSPDGSRLAVASLDGTVRTYLLRIEDLIQLANARVTRKLSLDECEKYLHQTTCPP